MIHVAEGQSLGPPGEPNARLRRALRGGVHWLHWPCGQNPGRKPEGHQRALAREAMSLGEQSSDLQGQSLCETRLMSRAASVALTPERAECDGRRRPTGALARALRRRRPVRSSTPGAAPFAPRSAELCENRSEHRECGDCDHKPRGHEPVGGQPDRPRHEHPGQGEQAPLSQLRPRRAHSADSPTAARTRPNNVASKWTRSAARTRDSQRSAISRASRRARRW